MKIVKILLVIAIAFGMMACNNEDVPQVNGEKDATISIKVFPSSDGPSVRAVGDLSSPATDDSVLVAESAIKTLEVFIFSGGLPDGYAYADANSATTITQALGILTHAGPKTIYVVANAKIDIVDNEEALLKKTKDLPVVIGNGLPMTSKKIEVTLVAGKNQYGFYRPDDNFDPEAKNHSEEPLPLVRVNARVAIVSATLSTTLPDNQKAIFDALTDIQVAMFNVPKTSKLFGASLAMNENYLYGEAWPTSNSSYTGSVGTYLKESNLSLPIANTAAPYFYVTENNAIGVENQMFIVVRGKPTKGGQAIVAEGLYTDKDGYTYYPVWVNATGKGYDYDDDYTATNAIVRNTQYNISLSINGIGNPYIDPSAEGSLDVNVSVTPWSVVTQNVVWGEVPNV